MANLSYNTSIFTDVHKYDNWHNYRGIFVTGKFNQKNGQDFKILDAIDIDWNGAFIKKLNTYLYTTEDVVNAFNLLGDKSINLNNYLNENFVTFSYLYTEHYNKDAIDTKIEDKAIEVTYNILGPVNESFNTLHKISQWIIDKSRYIKTDYINIVQNGKVISDKEYYIYLGENQYKKVDNEYILTHPFDDYYEFMFNDVIDLATEIMELRQKIGDEIYDPITNRYTYSGIYTNIHILDDNISYLSYEINNLEETLNMTYELADNSYWYAYNGYFNSKNNEKTIGYPSRHNVYDKIEIWDEDILRTIRNNGNRVWIYNEEDNLYTRTTYDPNYRGDYYMYYSSIPGSGIIKDIEDLNYKADENSKLLYKLNVSNDDISYLNLYLDPSSYINSSSRTLKGGIHESNVNIENGEITKGVITNNSLMASFTYVFNWKILNRI